MYMGRKVLRWYKKKFDAMVERVGWVDSLYAVWMSGYRLQLEAFRIKLNSVAEMLNPAMLALNPEKYAAKLGFELD